MGFLRNIATFVVVFAVIVQILLQLNKEQTGKASRFTIVFPKDNSSTKFERYLLLMLMNLFNSYKEPTMELCNSG